MYSKCMSMSDARRVFDNLLHRDVTCWTALILGYVENGESELALQLYEEFSGKAQLGYYVPDARVYVAALSACASLGTELNCLEKGKAIHAQAVASRCAGNVYVQNTLVDMYGRLGSMVDAREVFDSMVERDIVSWNVLLQGYVRNELPEMALNVFECIQGASRTGFAPDARSYVSVLSACTSLGAREKGEQTESRWLEKGEAIHAQAVKTGCSNIFVENTSIDMFAKLGCMQRARTVFDSMASQDSVSWNALLQGYVENEENEMALEMFHRMEKIPCARNARNLVAMLTACATLAGKKDNRFEEWFAKGKKVHSLGARHGCWDVYVENTLVDLYGKCRRMDLAQSVFDSMSHRNQVSWTALLQGYVENLEPAFVLKLFNDMEEGGGCIPNARILTVVLSACSAMIPSRENGEADTRWLARAKKVHVRAVELNCSEDIYVRNLLIEVYAKCGYMEEARTVFNSMTERDVVSWNNLLGGYVDNEENELVLAMVCEMNLSGVEMNSLTYIAALEACGNTLDVERGKALHEDLSSGVGELEDDGLVMNTLVDFYGKCGCMENAKQVFDSIRTKSVVSWTALMCGYSLQGDGERVIELFESMKEQGLSPNEVTFLCVLNACSHAGLTDKGKLYFEAMEEYGITPGVKHYVCVVDMLARANYLEEALRMVKSMPVEPNAVAWKAILAASRKWKHVSIGRLAHQALLKLHETDDASVYTMLTI